MFKDVIPLNSDIVVQAIFENEVKTEGGIIISTEDNPYSAKLFKAKILRVGDDLVGWHEDHAGLKPGDVVLCKIHSGLEVDDDIIIMKSEDVVGIMEKFVPEKLEKKSRKK